VERTPLVAETGEGMDGNGERAGYLLHLFLEVQFAYQAVKPFHLILRGCFVEVKLLFQGNPAVFLDAVDQPYQLFISCHLKSAT
jgi:hypothetical protein